MLLVVNLLLQVAGNYVEGSVRSKSVTCTLMLDALVALQAVGVTREGHVTGMVRDAPLEPKVAKAICTDPETASSCRGGFHIDASQPIDPRCRRLSQRKIYKIRKISNIQAVETFRNLFLFRNLPTYSGIMHIVRNV
jgi:hypothetical protein